MSISAAMVKELRERTGAGMMECKKALSETAGDMEAAIELMRKSGQAKADKKAGRTAAEGIVVIATEGKRGIILEVNCETDFVAKDAQFQAFAEQVAQTILANDVRNVAAIADLEIAQGKSVESERQALIARIGENIQVRRFESMTADGEFGSYRHGNRIGVLVDMVGGNEDLVKDVAMHVAASRPMCVNEDQVPADALAKEREIYSAQAEASGKPANIIEKMVDGRIRKYLGEVTLLGQPFVKDPDTTVGKLLKGADASVSRFVRYEVGEGIEKKSENFADEVMAQVRSSA
jgi:elongation factor Ts